MMTASVFHGKQPLNALIYKDLQNEILFWMTAHNLPVPPSFGGFRSSTHSQKVPMRWYFGQFVKGIFCKTAMDTLIFCTQRVTCRNEGDRLSRICGKYDAQNGKPEQLQLLQWK